MFCSSVWIIFCNNVFENICRTYFIYLNWLHSHIQFTFTRMIFRTIILSVNLTCEWYNFFSRYVRRFGRSYYGGYSSFNTGIDQTFSIFDETTITFSIWPSEKKRQLLTPREGISSPSTSLHLQPLHGDDHVNWGRNAPLTNICDKRLE